MIGRTAFIWVKAVRQAQFDPCTSGQTPRVGVATIAYAMMLSKRNQP
jgi:hypothetical protein